jgi:glutamine amidotransferase
VAVIATTPLTDDEIWTSFAAGSLHLFVDGSLAASVSTG